jgi:predicted transcriptional regulator
MKSLEFTLELLKRIRCNGQLTLRDVEFLIAIANGCKTNSDLSNTLGISKNNIRTHVKRLREKFLIITTNDRIREHTLTEEGRYTIRTFFSFLKGV